MLEHNWLSQLDKDLSCMRVQIGVVNQSVAIGPGYMLNISSAYANWHVITCHTWNSLQLWPTAKHLSFINSDVL